MSLRVLLLHSALVSSFLLSPALLAQEGLAVDPAADRDLIAETPAQREARLAWWREAKFGLFIHWGLYSVPAGRYGGRSNHSEWIMSSGKIPVAEYRTYAARFNPSAYDPAAWVAAAKAAGMGYVVITAKHHDGFALFPSDVTTWDIADATPYKKDLLAPLADATRSAGLRFGLYYSHALDWTHPGGAKHGGAGGDWDPAQKGDYDRYLSEVSLPQVRELVTRYQPDVFWWDFPSRMTPERAAPFAAALATRPGIISNNRLGGGYRGDVYTPEQFVPVTGYDRDWETCMTMGYHWGYNATDTRLKPAADLIHRLIEICAKGGNFLLNVGPDAEGRIPSGQLARLAEIGRWMDRHGESIHGTTAGPFSGLSWGYASRKGDRLYLHVTRWPADGELRVPLRSGVRAATLLTVPGKTLPLRREAERVVVFVPAAAPDPIASVVVLDLAEPPVVTPLPSLAARVTASAEQPEKPARNLVDGTGAGCWFAPATVKSATLDLDLGAPVAITGYGLDEPDVWPRLKQSFTLSAEVDGAWVVVASGKTGGHGKKATFAPAVTARHFRLKMNNPKGAPGVAELQLYQPE